MKQPNRPTIIPAFLLRSLAAAGLLAGFGATTSVADIVYVTSMQQGTTATALATDGSYTETGITLGNTSVKGTGAGRPVTANASRAYLSGTSYTGTGGVDIKPVPPLAFSSNDGSVVYQIDYNFKSLGNISTDVILSASATGGTLSFSSTDKFQAVYGVANNWNLVGYITNTSTQPVISFRYQSGLVNATSQSRLLFDCWRFTKLENCGATAVVAPDGPLATNLSTVNVTPVSSSATQVKVYQIVGNNTNLIGSSTVSSPPATVAVPVSGMAKTNQIIATQVVNSQEGCLPVAGVPAGGGANPRIRVACSIRQPLNLIGPVGVSGGGPAADIYWIHATGSAVAGGLVLQPSTNWQTVVFYPWDNHYLWNNNADNFTFPDPHQFGAFEGLAFAIDDLSDTGPMEIYIDNLRNGSFLIQDCEGVAVGTQPLLRQPSFSGSTSDNILADPNDASAVNTQAATGNQSIHVNWQWKDLDPSRWLRLNSGVLTNAGCTPNPEVDLTQPIAVDVLILPVNKTVAHSMGSMSLLPDTTNCIGTALTFTETMTPPTGSTPSYTYVWAKNGTTISGATGSSLTLNPVTASSGGTYSVTVSDGIASGTVSELLTVPQSVQIDLQPTDSGLNPIGSMWNFNIAASVPATCPCGNTPQLTYQWFHNGTLLGGATDSVYQNNSVQISDAGSYTCVVSNTCSQQAVTSATAKLYVYDPNVVAVNNCGTGILGLYYTNHFSTNAFAGSAAWTNPDTTITFDWAADSFNPGMFPNATDYFTVRWVGTIQAPYDQQHYVFHTTTDDGVRLWVNGQLAVDKWQLQGSTTWDSAPILLGTNAPVDIVMEYYENAGSAVAQLEWESESVVSNAVPQTALCAADPSTGIPPITTLVSPANNAIDTLPTPVTLTAAVTPQSTTVNKVEFYNNGTTLLATVNAPGPYTTSWTPPTTGVYNITARTYYNTSHTLNTPSNKLTVNAPAQSAVTITNITGNVVKYTGGAGSQFVLLATNHLYSPYTGLDLANWARLATNTVTPGSLTNSAGTAPIYYRIKSE